MGLQLKSPILLKTHSLHIFDYFKIFLAEVLGTIILMWVGCMGCVVNIINGPPNTDLHVGICFGLAVMLAILVVGHVSGAHLNPAVTTLAVILGEFPLILYPIYIIAQLIGCTLGILLVKLCTPNMIYSGGPGICSPVMNPRIEVWQGFVVEFLATSILCLMVCGTWDPRGKYQTDSAALRLGFGIVGLVLCCCGWTGTQVNPARSFAPSLINNHWDCHWVYWCAPLGAACFTGILYRVVYRPPLKGLVREQIEEEQP